MKSRHALVPAVLLLLGACSAPPPIAAEEEPIAPASIAGNTDGTTPAGPGCDSKTGDDAVDLAHALGVCNDARTDGFGLVAAELTRGFDDAKAPPSEQHAALRKFGDVLKPREGSALGVLSTGHAGEYNGSKGASFREGEKFWGSRTTRDALPPGYPQATSGCELSDEVTDVVVLKLTLKAPKDASGFKFDFNFHSSEWPQYICSAFNDGFLAYLTSKGRTGNISFDAKNNPVSVNNAFFDRCTPGVEVGCAGSETSTSVCAAGTRELRGTGFGVAGEGCGAEEVGGGATGWLTSSAPIAPEETFTLHLAIWDAGDGNLDSTVLLDNFRWVDASGAISAPTTERAVDVK